MNRSPLAGYCFITDAGLSRAGNESDVRQALAAGVGTIQYRCKEGSARELHREAAALRALCRGALFLVNDRVDLALAVEADGVHLGQDDLPYPVARRLLGDRRTIGITVRSVDQAVEAARMGADYVGVSPVFETRTKADAGRPCGLDLVRRVRRAVSIPVVAIGGITLENAPEVVAAGADGLCAISAVVGSHDVRTEIERFQRLFRAQAP